MKISISDLRVAVRRRGASAFARFAIVVACTSASACVHRAQVWPSPLAPGKQVNAKFDLPRAVSLDNDSLLVVKELGGTVISLHGDTLVMHLTSVPEQPSHAAWGGHDATIPLDSSTTVTRLEFDQSAVALMAVGAIAFVYAFIGSLPP